MGMSPRLLRPRATGFNPKSIAGLQMWMDASDVSTITTSTGVSEWRDKSSTGTKWVQATANNQPSTGTQALNGKNVLVFDGANDSLSAVAPLATSMPLTFFIVQRMSLATQFGMTYTTNSSTGAFDIRQNNFTGGLNIVASNTTVINLLDDRTGLTDIIAWIVPAIANSSLFRNGASLSLANASVKPILTGTHYIGQRSDGYHFNGWIAEIIAYSTELSAAQRKAVESYLGKKWGVVVS